MLEKKYVRALLQRGVLRETNKYLQLKQVTKKNDVFLVACFFAEKCIRMEE